MRRLAMVSLMVLAVGGAVLAGTTLFSKETKAKWEPYTQVVDNATGRFDASRWGATGQGDGYVGKNYKFARPSEGDTPALFKMRIPKTALYTVYARWPEDRGFNGAARIGVLTPRGLRWTVVDQRTRGGEWVKVGTFEMEGGDRYNVRISRDTTADDPDNGADPKRGDAPAARNSIWFRGGSSDIGGYVVADAIKVRKAFKYDVTGQDVLREAKTWVGEEYTLGGCSREEGVDCSCLTQLTYGAFGIYLPDNPGMQYGYGEEVAREDIQPGDLVYFKEHGPDKSISHVGIATGDGYMIHASSFTNKVSVGRIEYVYGYYGAKRLLPEPDTEP